MTTLGIIGGGIAGRSLIYALAKKKKIYSTIFLFDSEEFAHTCSLRSTAVVASRGVTPGHSHLGDLLVESYQNFASHIVSDKPKGVFPITQYTGAKDKLDQFYKRYPDHDYKKDFAVFKLKSDMYVASEKAFLVDTQLYLDWLLDSSTDLGIKVINEFVTLVEEQTIKTAQGSEFKVDQLVYAGGIFNQYWNFKTPSKSVQGSYLKFDSTDLGSASFSATLDGENLVYHAHSKTLLIGSTSLEATHEWPAMIKLKAIYERLSDLIDLNLPPMSSGVVVTGLREKATKREPYLIQEGKSFRIGGFYKNGFSLGLNMGEKLASELHRQAE